MTVMSFLFSKSLQKTLFYNWWDIQRFCCSKWSISPNISFRKIINTFYVYFLTLFTKIKPLEQIQRYEQASLLGAKSLFASIKFLFFFFLKNQSLIRPLSQCKIKKVLYKKSRVTRMRYVNYCPPTIVLKYVKNPQNRYQ